MGVICKAERIVIDVEFLFLGEGGIQILLDEVSEDVGVGWEWDDWFALNGGDSLGEMEFEAEVFVAGWEELFGVIEGGVFDGEGVEGGGVI